MRRSTIRATTLPRNDDRQSLAPSRRAGWRHSRSRRRAPAQRPSRVVVTQLTIHERITIRVPRMNVPGRVALTAPTIWKESKGPKCIAAASLAGAMVSAPATIDLVVQGGQRVRAKLGRQCRSVDFYSNFYIRPGSDGQVCADRDTIRVRSGAIMRDRLVQIVETGAIRPRSRPKAAQLRRFS